MAPSIVANTGLQLPVAEASPFADNVDTDAFASASASGSGKGSGSSGNVLRNLRLYPRQQINWSADSQTQLAKIVDDDGMFNGTCTSDRNGLPPAVASGNCASYYPNVTLYCCAAVGGNVVNSVQQGADGDGDSLAEGNTTVVEPACETDKYDTMLTCYMYTAEEHCRSAVTGPWGLCNPADGDSKAASPSSQVSDGVGIDAAIATAAAASQAWSLACAAALGVTTLLFFIGETIA